MKKNFNHCESVYWVFTQRCNDQCDHCYNLSGPQGTRMSQEDCLKIIDNLPDKIDRIILSGGEPIAEKNILYAILDKIQEKYQDQTQIMVQTNGDLLTPEILDVLLQKGVSRIDVASIDRYHKKAGARASELSELFESRGMSGEEQKPLVEKDNYLKKHTLSYGFWGATEDIWLGGNWARGRAMQKNIWAKKPQHNFCSILSGGRNFLGGYEDIPQEISIQLWKINPCCPGTKLPMGDARKEKVADVLQKVAQSPVFQKINQGKPLEMGEHLGISSKFAEERTKALQNICLWCDEFFDKHKQEKQTE